ncbi:hypothetical protein BJ875DRAFT_511167 [Amylocarpus encephaloides]|uniref:Uncharacterized protein n=1 Tax=Amylocarpus encephaloides TaxID=45428 RepID=A0A9P7YHN8_9HELO|nr:hypothetical protein BJ875DRAFT_511167 [Amylocarpus encephaloides]
MKLAKNLSRKVRNSADDKAKLDTSPKKSSLRISVPLDKNGRPIISKPVRSFSEADRRSYDSNAIALFPAKTIGTTATNSFGSGISGSGISTSYSNSPTTARRFCQCPAPPPATCHDPEGFEAPQGKFWLWYLCKTTGMMIERHEIDLSYINQDEKCALCDDLVFGPYNTVYTGWVKLKMEFKMLKEKPLRDARELRAKRQEDAVKLQELEMHMEQSRSMRQELDEINFEATLHREACEALLLRKRMEQDARELKDIHRKIQQKMEIEEVTANVNGNGGIDCTKLGVISNNRVKGSFTESVEETSSAMTCHTGPRYMRDRGGFYGYTREFATKLVLTTRRDFSMPTPAQKSPKSQGHEPHSNPPSAGNQILFFDEDAVTVNASHPNPSEPRYHTSYDQKPTFSDLPKNCCYIFCDNPKRDWNFDITGIIITVGCQVYLTNKLLTTKQRIIEGTTCPFCEGSVVFRGRDIWIKRWQHRSGEGTDHPGSEHDEAARQVLREREAGCSCS